MRMSMKNIAVAGVILTFVFVYTIHINWKQKKEIASYSSEVEVYEKHVDELTAKLNECMDRKTQWGNKFESEKKRSAKLQTDLDAAQGDARKSQADSSAQSRQSGERVSDLEGQVKLLTEVRASLERENQDLRRQRAEQLANETDALSDLRKQLVRALTSEKLLQLRIETVENATRAGGTVISESTTPETTPTTTTASTLLTQSAANATGSAAASTTANATGSGVAAANPVSNATGPATSGNKLDGATTTAPKASGKSDGPLDGAVAAPGAEAVGVLRPPVKLEKVADVGGVAVAKAAPEDQM